MTDLEWIATAIQAFREGEYHNARTALNAVDAESLVFESPELLANVENTLAAWDRDIPTIKEIDALENAFDDHWSAQEGAS